MFFAAKRSPTATAVVVVVVDAKMEVEVNGASVGSGVVQTVLPYGITIGVPKLNANDKVRARQQTASALSVGAYGPALFVGNIEVSHSELADTRTWRFLYFETEKLKPGAPISWGWMKHLEKNRLRTAFRYDVDVEGEGGTSSAS